jgi:aminoglycoside phosphotransferase (APT) family kinase protein
MALINELDEAGVQTRLSAWLDGRLGGARDVRISDVTIPQSAGLSMTTILLKASWTQDGEDKELDLVARVAPPTPGVFEDTDLEREYNLLRALEGTGVKVPTARWVENDPDVLGGQFVIVDRAYGEVPAVHR